MSQLILVDCEFLAKKLIPFKSHGHSALLIVTGPKISESCSQIFPGGIIRLNKS